MPTQITNMNQPLYGTLLRTDTIKGVVKTSTSQVLAFRRSVYRESDRTPDYRGKIARGERLPINRFVFRREIVNIPQGTWQYLWVPNGDRNDYVGPWPNGYGSRQYLATSQTVVNNMNAECEARVLDKIKDQKVNLAIALATMNQTVGMISGALRAILNARVALKKGQFVSAARALGLPVNRTKYVRARKRFNRIYPTDPTAAVANAWLQLHFGWEQLVQDVQGGIEVLLLHHKSAYEKVHEVYAKVKRAVDDEVHPTGDFVTRRRTKTTIKYTCHFQYDHAGMANLSSLGLLNPLPVIWDLTAWSFVWDWVLPIGRFLNNLDATVGVRFIDTIWTRADEATIEMRIDDSYVIGNTKYSYRLNGDTTLFTLERNPSKPPSVLTLPRFKNPLSVSHAASAVALIRQLTR